MIITYTSIVSSVFQESCLLKPDSPFSLFPFLCVFSLHFFSFFLFLFLPSIPSLPPFFLAFPEPDYQRNTTNCQFSKTFEHGFIIGFTLMKRKTLLKRKQTFGQNSIFVTILRKYRKSPFSPNSAGCNSLLSSHE